MSEANIERLIAAHKLHIAKMLTLAENGHFLRNKNLKIKAFNAKLIQEESSIDLKTKIIEKR